MEVVYNGVSLPFQVVDDLDCEAVIENGHYRHTRKSVQVQGVISLGQTGVALPGETFAQTCRRVRHSLERPRCPLAVWFDDPLRPFADLRDGRDCETGPTPQVLSFTRLVGTGSAHVRFRVTWCVRECEDGGDPGPPWTYHAWNESIDLDQRKRAVLSRQGIIRLRGDRGLWADLFRDVVTPRVPRGFVRVKATYRVQEDGLALAYSFTDREVWAQPPDGAEEADGTYTVTSVNAARMQASVRLTLGGRNDTPKQNLVELAVAVAMNRLTRGVAPNGPKGTGKWLILGSVTEQMYENQVTVELRVDVVPPKAPTGPRNRGLLFDLVDVITGGPKRDFVVGLWKKLTGQEQKEKGKEGGAGETEKGVGEAPRGIVEFGFDRRPKFSERLRSQTGDARGSARLLVLVSRALEDPCLARLVQELGDPPDPVIPAQLVPPKKGQIFRPPWVKDTGDTPPAGNTDDRPEPRFKDPYFATAGGRPAELSSDVALGGDPWGLGAAGDGEGEGLTPFADVFEVDQLPSPDEWRAGAGQLVNGGAGESSCEGMVWTACFVHGRYEEDLGVAARTEMREGGLTHPVTVRAKRTRYTVEWYFERAGKPPEVPDSRPADSNYFLVDRKFEPHMDLAADGVTPVFTVAGRYEYYVKDPSLVKYGATVSPWAAEALGRGPKPAVQGGPEVASPDGLADAGSGRPAWQQAVEDWAGESETA